VNVTCADGDGATCAAAAGAIAAATAKAGRPRAADLNNRRFVTTNFIEDLPIL
jgi:hypothetical protein